MKLYFVVTIVSFFTLISGQPTGNVEIQRQRLIKFPEETFQYQLKNEKTTETQRILDEINKINTALGYVKKYDPPSPTILDSEKFLFPKQSYHQFYSPYLNSLTNGPIVRDLNLEQLPISRKIVHHHSLMIPQILQKSSYKQDELRDSPRLNAKIQNIENDNKELINQQNLMAISNDVTSIIEYGGNNINPLEMKPDKVEGRNQEYTEGIEKSNYQNDENDLPGLQMIFFPSNAQAEAKALDNDNGTIKRIIPQRLIKINKPKNITKIRKNNDTPKESEKSVADILGTLQRPFHRISTKQPNLITSTKPIADELNHEDDYIDLSGNVNEDDKISGTDKHLFHTLHNGINEVQKQALKEGGILIQRLRVRKGGIAIAGPGGVATAGSGGTAIVGPGGVALTHPRSLTIAGPGARVIALPTSYDLDKALLNTSAQNIPKEGKLVATGPAVYYSPEV